jgi:hypothetical protein
VKGEVAPFSGQLITNKRASINAGLLLQVEDLPKRLEVEKQRIQKLADIDLRLAKKEHDIDKKACKAQKDLLKERLKEAKEEGEPPFWERPAFVATVTVILTAAVFYGAFEVAGKLKGQ